MAVLVGAGLVVASRMVATSAIPEGGRTLEGFGLLALGLAVAAFGLLTGTGRGRFAALVALFVAGLGARLVLTLPLWLQTVRVRSHEIANPSAAAALAVIAIQGLVVVSLYRRRAGGVVGAIVRVLGGRLTAALVAAFLACAVHVTFLVLRRAEPAWWRWFATQHVVTAFLVGLDLLNLVALARALPADQVARSGEWARRVSWPGDRREASGLDRLVPWILGAFVAVVAACLARFGMAGIPYIPDAIAYVFQAECYAGGRLSIPAPPVPEAFTTYLVTVLDGRMFGVVHPGWPAVLAVGARFGVTWLVNPLLAGLTVPLVHALVRRLADRGTANFAALLLATSPWFLWLSASHMTHTVSLLLVAAGWVAAVGAAERRHAGRAAVAGLCFGWLCTVRPLDGLLIGGLTGAWLLVRRVPLVTLVAYGIGCVVGTLPLLFFNQALSGSATEFPLNAYIDALWYPGANAMGFGPDIGNPPLKWGILDPFPGHSWRDVLLNTNQNLYNLNFETFGWSIGSLGIMVIGLLSRRREHDRPLATLLLALWLTYSLYWFSGGPDFGARYWYLMLLPLLWFATRGLVVLRERCAVAFPEAGVGARIGIAVAVLVASSLTVFMPWRAIGKYERYRGFHADYRDMAESGVFGRRGLVFVNTPNDADWGCAFILNPLDHDADRPLFVRDLGADMNHRVALAHPGRPAYRVDGPGVTGGRARLIDTSDMGMGR